jgi:hypothetical protein
VPTFANVTAQVLLLQEGVTQSFPVAQLLPQLPQFWTVVRATQLSGVDGPLEQQTSPEAQDRRGLFLPSGTGEHVPMALGVLQASQVELQAVLQQTPSAQKSLWHSAGPRHAAPMAFVGVQLPVIVLQN